MDLKDTIFTHMEKRIVSRDKRKHGQKFIYDAHDDHGKYFRHDDP